MIKSEYIIILNFYIFFHYCSKHNDLSDKKKLPASKKQKYNNILMYNNNKYNNFYRQ